MIKPIKDNISRKISVYFFIIHFFLGPVFCYSQPETIKPKLIVGIIVDQMRYDYLTRYYNKFGNEGFKKLIENGTNCKNVHYDYIPTYTGPGHASIFTGTNPDRHGIVGNNWYNKDLKRMVYVTWDPDVTGTGTGNSNGNHSPSNLFTTTFGDELRISNNFNSKVIGISMKDRGAILPAGRSGNAAYWLDNENGNWVSSSWYMSTLPECVKKFNKLKISDSILNTPWVTLLPIEQYSESTEDNTIYEKNFPDEKLPVFPHHLNLSNPLNYELVKYCPGGNTMTTDFAIEAIINENLGKDEFTDLISVSYSATDYIGHDFGTHSIETEDAYLRLDQDIAKLIDSAEKLAGKDNVLFFLTSDHGVIPVAKFLSDNKIATGIFDINAMADSLRSYIASKYNSEEKLISAVYNDQIYIDNDLLQKNSIDFESICKDIVEYLHNIKGVDAILTRHQLLNNEYTLGTRSTLQNGYNKKRSGDIIFSLDPGLVEHSIQGTDHGSGYNYDTHVPLLFYGTGIDKNNIVRKINIIDIAPTLSVLLGIQPPNSSTGAVITELFK